MCVTGGARKGYPRYVQPKRLHGWLPVLTIEDLIAQTSEEIKRLLRYHPTYTGTITGSGSIKAGKLTEVTISSRRIQKHGPANGERPQNLNSACDQLALAIHGEWSEVQRIGGDRYFGEIWGRLTFQAGQAKLSQSGAVNSSLIRK